ncbi:hypothetical protein Tco_0772927 [Tanacetum coccineum]|uniref:Uncharacterized protein n=1 Tax=Tanacetum coccineum TaxID=301880 RepID=A0ABQ4ZKK0_9ASTR
MNKVGSIVPLVKHLFKSLSKSLDNLHYEVVRLSAALNQATILKAKRDEEILRLNATPSEFSSFFRGQFQGLVRKFLASDEFSRVQGELLSLATSAGFERGLSMHWTKDEFADVLKKMVNFMLGAQERLVEASPILEPEKLVRPANVPILRDTRVSPPIAKESTVKPVPKSLELSANVALVSSDVASEQNEEQVNAVVDGSDLEMADGAAPSKSGGVFVQGVSHVLDDVVEATAVESERISSVPTDVVVALSIGGKGDGYVPSSTIKEIVSPFRCLEAASSANSASQSMAWLDALNFNQMAYEYIFSSRLTRIIPTPEPSSIVSLPKYNLQALVAGVKFA